MVDTEQRSISEPRAYGKPVCNNVNDKNRRCPDVDVMVGRRRHCADVR